MLLLVLVAAGLVIAFLQMRGDAKKTGDKKEKFETEKDAEADTEVDAEVDAVAKAFQEKRGETPSATDVRKAIKSMRKNDQTAEQAVGSIVAKDKPAEKPAAESRPVDAGILRRVEDELESVANRIDALLDEIHSIRAGAHEAPFSQYHPLY